MPTVLRVVVVEDSLLVREGLCRLLTMSPRVAVVGSCSSLPEAVSAVEETEPDVVLTDVRMPPTFTDEGVQLARQLRRTHPRLGVVVLSQYAEPSYAAAVLGDRSSRRAYMLKDGVHDLDRVVRAIVAVASGDSFIDDEVMRALVRSRDPQRCALRTLSPREQEVLSELAEGASNRTIARALGVSDNAVEKHVGAGNSGDDLVVGNAGRDWLEGNEGNDRVDAVTGDDGLPDSAFGGAGDDFVNVRDGVANDVGQGDAGADVCWGDAGEPCVP